MFKIKNIGRKKFFKRLGAGTIGVLLIAKSPIRIFQKDIPGNSGKIKLKIHPSAVQRTKRF
ncbi:MAG: hypothetical protein JW995_00410 [Melioribacteraceae bacterium]|nr:hypothetical protein [Melioribacteraceae bacterium]